MRSSGVKYVNYPTKVLLIDDSQSFLDAITVKLEDTFVTQAMTDPRKAIKIIQQAEDKPLTAVYKRLDNAIHDEVNDKYLDIDISEIYRRVYDKGRFDSIAVVIVDYQMPEMNGIEFCEEVRQRLGLGVKIILLTALDDKGLAVKAFNDHLIDKFIMKAVSDLDEELGRAILDLQSDHFKGYTKALINNIGGDIQNISASSAYQEKFSEIIQEVKAVESYLVDEFGSVLFLNEAGMPTWFIVRPKAEMERNAALLKEYEMPDKYVKQIEGSKKLLFLLGEQDYQKPSSEWVNHLFDCKPLTDGVFCSIIHDKTDNLFAWDKLISFQSYRHRE